MRTAQKTIHKKTVRVIDKEPGMDFGREFTLLWKDYRKALARCCARLSPKSLHRLRIALRRLSVALELCQAASPAVETSVSVGCIRKQLKKLGPLRDIHTQLEHVNKYREMWPVLRRYKKALLTERKSGRGKLERFLCGLKTRKVKTLIHKAWTACVLAGHKSTAARDAELAPARRYLRTLWMEIRRRIKSMDAGRLASLHHLRVAIKRMRYTGEFLKPVLNETEKKALRQLEAWQMRLGRIQDMRILLASMKEWLKDQPASIKTEFKVPCRELKRRLSRRSVHLADKMSRTSLRLKVCGRWADGEKGGGRPLRTQSIRAITPSVYRHENGFALFVKHQKKRSTHELISFATR
jgi:CHAD domain-containing protein